MSKEKNISPRRNFDYEEDDYDRLKNMGNKNRYHQSFTNKVTLKKTEFDYEEDPYEPEKSK
ncbi:MAG: hypothetical protein ACM3TR_05940 [Caulobacteraceae bacterium]